MPDAPQHNADGDRNVERVLGALLRNLQRQVARIHHFLLHAGYFISEYQGDALARSGLLASPWPKGRACSGA